MSKNNIHEIFSVARENIKKNTDFPVNKLLDYFKNSDFILYGAGETGAYVVEKLKQINIRPMAFADDTEAKQHKLLQDVQIYSLEKIKEICNNNIVIFITIFQPSVSFLSLKEKLISQGFTNIFSLLDLFYAFPESFLPYYQFDRIEKLIEQEQEYAHAYDLFEEPESREIFLSNLRFKLSLQHNDLFQGDDQHYFPLDIYPDIKSKLCFYIDCGAYDGDTIKKFLDKDVSVSKICAFEPDQYNFIKLTDYVTKLDKKKSEKIYLYPFGISGHHGYHKFSSSGTMGSAFNEKGNVIIQMVSLDDLFYDTLKNNEDAIFIKMDIEGEEMKALQASQKIVKEKSPNLAISIYHHPDDLWKVPLSINALNPGYKFYLRQHGEDSMDLVLYTVPKI